MTAASNVAFAELYWTPSDHLQCEDRCYGRLSNLHGANIWYLIAADTIEEKITELLEKKARILDQILDGKAVDDESVFTNLLESLK